MRIKYPRTPHLPWSLGKGDDDKVLTSVDHFIGKDVTVTIKMDGECTTLYSDYIHARSLDSKHHESRSWMKAFHAEVRHLIPPGYRICGENLYAKHSIHYLNLDSFFLVYSVWNEENISLAWKEVETWCSLLGLKTVPVIYSGFYPELMIQDFPKILNTFHGDPCEGYVVRVSDSFPYSEFSTCVAKFVRASHVQTDKHWMSQPVVPNQLKGDTFANHR